MKKIVVCLLGLAALGTAEAFPFDEIVDKRMLVLGDSIAQAGDWVSDVRYYLAKKYPGKDIDFTNIGLASEGLSGISPYARHEKLYGFANPWIVTRLGSALKKLKPEVVVMMYGMNDSYPEVYAQGEFPMFKNGFERVLMACRDCGVKKFIVLTPTPFGDFSSEKEKCLSEMSAWLRGYKAADVEVVDMHGRFKALVETRREPFSGDNVHPNAKYHFEMAKIVLAAGGIDVPAEDSSDTISRDPLWRSIDMLQRTQDDCTRRWIGYVREAAFSKPERYTAAEKEKIEKLKEQCGITVR